MSVTDKELDRDELRISSAHGVVLTFASQMVRFASNFFVQVWLARMLLPTDFGLVAMATPFLNLAGVFSDFGLTQATVQKPGLTEIEAGQIFWLNLGAGAVLAALLSLTSPLIARFYHEPRLSLIVVALAGAMLLGGLYAQHLALLARRLEFGKLAVIDLVSAPVGWIAAIYAASHGAGLWALILNSTVSSATACMLTISLLPWRPGRPRLDRSSAGLARFGGNVTLSNLADLFASNLDNVLLGRIGGGAVLGVYDRAYKLLLLPTTQILTPIGRVAGPLLARTSKDERAFKRAFSRMLDVPVLLIAPPIVFAAFMSDLLVPRLLGPQWAEVAPVFRVLGLGALLAPYSAAASWLLLAQERTRELRNWALVRAVLLSAGFFAGVPWGAVGVSVSYVACSAVIAPSILFMSTRRGALPRSALRSVATSHAFSAGMLMAFEAALRLSAASELVKLCLGALLAYPVFLVAMRSTRAGRAALADIFSQAEQMLQRAAGAPGAGASGA